MSVRPTPLRRDGARPRHVAAFLAVSLAALGACSGTRTDGPVRAATAPVVRGAESGIEVALWVVDDRDGALAAAIRGYLDRPVPAAPDQVRLWRANGLHIFAVPLAAVEDVRPALPVLGPVQRQWLGLLPEWAEVVKGPELASERYAGLDSGVLRLEPGRLRMLARCWTTPDLSRSVASIPASNLRLELMPQLADRRRRDPLAPLAEPVPSSAPDAGLTFPRLTLSLAADGSDAFVIVGASPDHDWTLAVPPVRPETPQDGVVVSPFGPLPPGAPTIGELMLTGAPLASTAETTRVVLVVLPRVAERFELIRN
ncbi:MAG: hypothetical protein KIS87_10575 [Phycisphaeraceae bacterium]|nr:hypothetical protein [Phycisphaeraceae bacterium]